MTCWHKIWTIAIAYEVLIASIDGHWNFLTRHPPLLPNIFENVHHDVDKPYKQSYQSFLLFLRHGLIFPVCSIYIYRSGVDCETSAESIWI